MKIGRRTPLIRHRRERGLSEAELGALVGLSEHAIRKYENGERTPSPERAAKIARALKTPGYVLFPDLAEQYKFLFREHFN